MILSISQMEFEALQRETGTEREPRPMGRRAFVVADLHLIGPTEVITYSHVDMAAKQHIGTDGDMSSEGLVPVSQST